MGVGLYLKGRIRAEGKLKRSEAESWLKGVARWLPEGAPGLLLGSRTGRHEKWPALFFRLHPGAEEVELYLTGAGRLTVSAATSPVGPGYHIYACELLDRLGEQFGVRWEAVDPEEGGGDETGYFHSRDRAAVEEEMLTWIGAVAGQVVGLMGEMSNVRIAMPLDCEYSVEGAAVTPLGPRDEAWFRAVAADHGQARDFFSWWPTGLGAEFHLGRALVRMWNEIRWRPPLEENEDEEDLLTDVLHDLERAYLLDPTLPYPWREWHELLGYYEEAFGDLDFPGSELEDLPGVVGERAAATADGPRIGYRRGEVKVSLGGGWTITVPGSFAESWDEDGNWAGWDEKRTVHVKSFQIQKNDGSMPSAEELLDMSVRSWETAGCERLADFAQGPLHGRAIFGPHEEDGKTMWRLNAFSATPGNVALCNCYFGDAADREWAVASWHSLSHRGKAGEEE